MKRTVIPLFLLFVQGIILLLLFKPFVRSWNRTMNTKHQLPLQTTKKKIINRQKQLHITPALVTYMNIQKRKNKQMTLHTIVRYNVLLLLRKKLGSSKITHHERWGEHPLNIS